MGRMKNFSEEVKKQAIYNYVELHQGLQTAGKQFGISQFMMEKILKEYGIKKRTYTEAKQIGRKYTCDDNYFKNQNNEMAYILGLIASDGSISKKENLVAIQLQEEDKYILEKIREMTKTQRLLEEYIRRETGHKIYSFRNWSSEWKKDLAHYGICPQKTFTLQPPLFLNKKYNIDYIRGYFDGDGSIYRIESQNRVFFEITGASKIMIDWIYDQLTNQYHIYTNKKTQETLANGTVMYKIKIGDKTELKKLYNLLYDEKNFYLKRKKEKFENLLNIPRDSNSSN